MRKKKKGNRFLTLFFLLIIASAAFFCYRYHSEYLAVERELTAVYEKGIQKVYASLTGSADLIRKALVSSDPVYISKQLNKAYGMIDDIYQVVADFEITTGSRPFFSDFLYGLKSDLQGFSPGNTVPSNELVQRLIFYTESIENAAGHIRVFLDIPASEKAKRKEFYSLFERLSDYFHNRNVELATALETEEKEEGRNGYWEQYYKNVIEDIENNPADNEFADIAKAFLGAVAVGRELEFEGYSGENGENVVFAIDDGGRTYRVHINVFDKSVRAYYAHNTNQKPSADGKLSVERGEKIARDFLNEHGFADTVKLSHSARNGTVLFSFLESKDGVMIYPGRIELEVSLKEGRVISFYRYPRLKEDLGLSDTASEFSFPQNVEIDEIHLDLAPAISLSAARERINPQNKIMSVGDLVLLHGGKLCWRFKVENNGRYYWVFINAENGQEEAIWDIPNGN